MTDAVPQTAVAEHATAVPSPPARVRALVLAPGTLSALVVVAGVSLAIVGGVGRPGALDLLPCLDGALTSGVVGALLLALHGHRERLILPAIAPIVAITSIGFLNLHPRPLAPLGLEIALIGAVVLVAERLRARSERPAT